MESHGISESKQVQEECMRVQKKEVSVNRIRHLGALFRFMQMKCSNYPVRKADK